ncbi:MAG: glycosyltransferase family 39 protein [Anaerolinea sp.]|nr:glycosyltransferase family 39 protein [Anaerolinea sp.]
MIASLIPDWLLPTVLLIPAALWMFFGVGGSWARALLPRSDWRNLPLMAGMSIALGGAITTGVMFVLGTFGRFNLINTLLATGIASLVGWMISRRNSDGTPPSAAAPLGAVDKTLLVITLIAVGLRFWNTAYWCFTTYDALWVYGFNARLFMLEGAIPPRIGYYPQLIPLSYTYFQLMWGAINDHAARVVLPYFAAGSAIMTYLLGKSVFNRRAGLLAAALWMLYPHHGVWSQFGDLEVTTAFYFTGAAAFLILGWNRRSLRYGLISGFLTGAALWTKPTAAALIQSLALIGAGWLLFESRSFFPRLIRPLLPLDQDRLARLRYLLLVGIAAVPLGGVWYVRNILMGHPPLTMPPGYWQDAAQRSGQELGFPLIIIGALVIGWMILKGRERLPWLIVGLILILIGSLPSAFGGRLPTGEELRLLFLGQIVPTLVPTRLHVLEYFLIGAGIGLLIGLMRPAWGEIKAVRRGALLALGAFILPYFVTWFWSYSYHFRLSFAIVPALIVVLAGLITAAASRVRVNQARRVGAVLIIVLLAVPGWWVTLTGLEPALTSTLPDDHAKLAQGNAALMGLVDFLQHERERLGRPLKVIAPGELRLNFFFPQDAIHGDAYPLTLDEIADLDFFVDSSVGQRLYLIQDKGYNQILASLTRPEVLKRVYTVDDQNFRFSVYTIDNQSRFKPRENGVIQAQIGDFAELVDMELTSLKLSPGDTLYLTNYWWSLRPATLDYSIFVHLWDANAQKLVASWGGQPVEGAWSVWKDVPGAHFSVAYPTRLWQVGELIKDEWRMLIPPDVPPGRYELRVGMFEPISGERLPVIQEGQTRDSIFVNWFEVVPR